MSLALVVEAAKRYEPRETRGGVRGKPYLVAVEYVAY